MTSNVFPKLSRFTIVHMNMVSRTHPGHILPVICTLALVLWFIACDKLDITPGDFQYPLTLTVQSRQSVTELSWSQATVSSFEEYVILRSTDDIPDSPEPEVTGNTIIIARIDERNVTTFKDSNLPIADSVYYKVYARISGRFLMSNTFHHVQKLHLIPARVDIVEPVVSDNKFIALDRATHQLFVYDYITREFITSKAFAQVNFPLISYSSTNDEILLCENGTAQFIDYSTLDFRQSMQTGFVRGIEYANGWIYLTRAQPPFSFALYRRSDLTLRDEINTLQTDWRGFIVHPDAMDANKATIYDFSIAASARYVQSGTNLDVDKLSSEILSGGLIIPTSHPQREEFVITNSGIIVNGDLQLLRTLENGTMSFSLYAFTPDGSRLFGFTFFSNPVLRVYDANDDYTFIEEHTLSNQISPVALFADDDNVYLVSLVFLISSSQTLITTIEY